MHPFRATTARAIANQAWERDTADAQDLLKAVLDKIAQEADLGKYFTYISCPPGTRNGPVPNFLAGALGDMGYTVRWTGHSVYVAWGENDGNRR